MSNSANEVTNMATNSTHPFEAARLGKAPFKFIGMHEQDLCYGQAILNREEFQRTGVSVTTKPGGSCAYCGNYIVNMYNVRSADGQVFHVGSECIEKTGDRKLIEPAKAARCKAAGVKRAVKASEVQGSLEALLVSPEARAKLAAAPHPKPLAWRAPEENTLLAYIEWMSVKAGAAGRKKALALATSALAAVEV